MLVTASLTLFAVVLFLLAKVIDHYREKYSGMSDFSRISAFVCRYWRTSRAASTTFFCAAFMCAWFATRNLDVVQLIAMLILVLSGFWIALLILVSILKTLELIYLAIFGKWELRQISDYFLQIRQYFNGRIWDLKENTRDVLGSSALTATTTAIFVVTLWSMGATVIDLTKL